MHTDLVAHHNLKNTTPCQTSHHEMGCPRISTIDWGAWKASIPTIRMTRPLNWWTGAMCKSAGLYQRLSCHQAQEVAAEELTIAEYDRKNDPDNNNMATALKTPLAGPSSKATMLEAAIDPLPEWCDCDTTHYLSCTKESHPGALEPLDRASWKTLLWWTILCRV